MPITDEQIAEMRDTLQAIKYNPQNAVERAWKAIELDGMSNPSYWYPDIVQIVWYGWCKFKQGFEAATMAVLSEPTHTGFHVAASMWMDKEQFIMVSDLKGALE